MKGEYPGEYVTKPYGRWPFKYRVYATPGNVNSEHAQWTIKLQRWSRLEDRWITKRGLVVYPEEISVETCEINRERLDRDVVGEVIDQ